MSNSSKNILSKNILSKGILSKNILSTRMTKSPQRNHSGASLALVAVCAFALVFFIVLCFKLMMVFGGIRELNSTADAAALNIAQRSMQIKTPASALYTDCADSQDAIGLANINRVWGKAYLINANVEQMTANQQLTDQATNSADQAFGVAQSINDQLFTGLNNMQTLGSFFDQIAGMRLHRMLGKQVSSDANSEWATALAYRGDQSNLAVQFSQIPGPANSHLSIVTAGNNATYLPGYNPIQTNNKEFYFVPFHNAERTHLITENYFQHSRPDKAALTQVNNPLPNAFSGHGTTENSLYSQSFAVANPQIQYNLAIPHAYATISLANIAFWIVQNKQVNITNYGFAPEKQLGANHIPLRNPATNLVSPKDYLDGYASLGNEFKGGVSLLQAITSIQPDVLVNLVQRIQEINPNFTLYDLEQLLQQQQLVSDASTYFIYPNYTTPDNTDPTIKVTPLDAQGIKVLPKWLAAIAINEGQTKTIATETPVQDDPNYDWELVFGPHFQQGAHWTEVGGNVNWTPGTGFNQTLGRLTAVHTTRCYFDVNSNNNNQ